ncbi:MFS transporter [Streptomyces platensis]|uniref:MFS transporter n=1 Tax=Streptomyces platensis TaxID=58346 RepID=UPI002ED69A91|nr:MFS transporter [Streptomyces platensis]
MLLKRRHVALLAGLACMTAAFGVNFAAGALFPFLAAEHGWSTAALGAVAGLNTALTGLLQPLVGRALDAWGARRVLLIGMSLLVAAQLLLSVTSQLWQFVLAYGVLGAAGFAASSTPPVSALVSRWFPRRKASALTVITAGINLGQLLVVPAAAFLAGVEGVPTSYTFLGAGAAVLVIPLLLATPTEPPVASAPSAPAKATSAAARLGSLTLTITFGLHALSLYMVMLALPQYAIDHGTAPAASGNLAALAAAASLAAMIATGVLLRRAAPRSLLYALHALRTLALLLLAFAPGPAMVLAGTVLFGLSSFATIPLTVAALTEKTPASRLGRSMARAWLVHQTAAALGVAAGGAVHAWTGSYTPLLAGIAAAPLLALVLLLRSRTADADAGATTQPAPTHTSDTSVPDLPTSLTTKGMS